MTFRITAYVLNFYPPKFTIEITGNILATVIKTVISIVDYLYFKGQIIQRSISL